MSRPSFFFLLLPVLVAGCAGAGSAGQSTATPSNWSFTSPAFSPGGLIPVKYSCQGDNLSPALNWDVPPAGTKNLALILDDPDAPAGTWVHWVVYNLPPDLTGLPEGSSRAKSTTANLPAGAMQGMTSNRRADYGGPCPPAGQHRYFFKLYALDTAITTPNLDKAALLKAMEGHILAQAELMGVFKK